MGCLGFWGESLLWFLPGSWGPGSQGSRGGLTRVVGQAAGLAVKAEPPLPPGLDTTSHLHQGSAAVAPRHPYVRAAFRVVAPAFQVLPEIQDPRARRAGWGCGRGLGKQEKGAVTSWGGGAGPAAWTPPRGAGQSSSSIRPGTAFH